jgi:toxin HigB-1
MLYVPHTKLRIVIRSFKNNRTARLFAGENVREFQGIKEQATRKLSMLDEAKALTDLGAAPGNRLEALKGDRKGQHSMRINDQWRLCFRWTSAGPEEVEIVDYHR